MLGLRSHPQRSWIARRLRLRPAVPRPLPLDPAARGESPAAGAWLDHVALSGVAAARRRGSANHPRRGRDAAAHGAVVGGEPRHREQRRLTLGEGGTPLLTVPRLAAKHGLRGLFVKEEGANPTGSFKARGLAAAVTRA